MAIFAQFEVGMPDDPKLVEAGDIAELVYYRAIMRCRDHLTDGVIDRRVAARWFAGIRGKPAAHLDRLMSVGLLHEHPDGWRIPEHVWRRRNPMKSEVDQRREEEAARKAGYRARKQAQREDVPQMSQRDNDDVPDMSHDCPEPVPARIDRAIDIDRDIDKEEAHLSEVTSPAEPTAEGGESSSTRRDQVLDLYVASEYTKATQAGTRIAYESSWRKKARSTGSDHPDLDRWLVMFPSAPASAVAGWLAGDKHSMGYYERVDEPMADVVQLRKETA